MKTMTVKLTKEQKMEAEFKARQEKEGLDYRDWQARQRSLIVVNEAHDVFQLQRHVNAPFFGQDRIVEMIYNALYRYEQAVASYRQQLSHLESKLNDAKRSLDDKCLYSTAPLQSSGTDVDQAHNATVITREAVVDICRAFNVFYAAAYSQFNLAARAKKLSYSVRRSTVNPEAWAVQNENGDSPDELVAACGNQYASEAAAWLAAKVIGGGNLLH